MAGRSLADISARAAVDIHPPGYYWLLNLWSRIFGDRQWEQPTGWGYGLVIWGGLTLYWIAPSL